MGGAPVRNVLAYNRACNLLAALKYVGRGRRRIALPRSWFLCAVFFAASTFTHLFLTESIFQFLAA